MRLRLPVVAVAADLTCINESRPKAAKIPPKALAVLTQGEKDAAGLASALQVGEESARYMLCHLAASGKITLTGKVNA